MARQAFRIEGVNGYCKFWLAKTDWIGKFVKIKIRIGETGFTTEGPFRLQDFLSEFTHLVESHDGEAKLDNRPGCSIKFWTKPNSDFIRMTFNVSLIDPEFADPLLIKGGLKFDWGSSRLFLNAFRILASKLEES